MHRKGFQHGDSGNYSRRKAQRVRLLSVHYRDCFVGYLATCRENGNECGPFDDDVVAFIVHVVQALTYVDKGAF
jgi:hypothetical protein